MTQELLYKLFEYKDGFLYWKQRIANQVDITKPAGCVDKKGYRMIEISAKGFLAHRLIFLMHHGYLPKIVDHKDRNPANNNIDNLREATRTQNQQNRKTQKSFTGFKGVYFCPERNNRYRAAITVNKKRVELGTYDTPEEASEAYKKGAIIHFKEFANV